MNMTKCEVNMVICIFIVIVYMFAHENDNRNKTLDSPRKKKAGYPKDDRYSNLYETVMAEESDLEQKRIDASILSHDAGMIGAFAQPIETLQRLSTASVINFTPDHVVKEEQQQVLKKAASEAVLTHDVVEDVVEDVMMAINDKIDEIHKYADKGNMLGEIYAPRSGDIDDNKDNKRIANQTQSDTSDPTPVLPMAPLGIVEPTAWPPPRNFS